MDFNVSQTFDILQHRLRDMEVGKDITKFHWSASEDIPPLRGREIGGGSFGSMGPMSDLGYVSSSEVEDLPCLTHPICELGGDILSSCSIPQEVSFSHSLPQNNSSAPALSLLLNLILFISGVDEVEIRVAIILQPEDGIDELADRLLSSSLLSLSLTWLTPRALK
jgi:hypothetical protein